MAKLQFDENVIRNVVAQVLAEVGSAPAVPASAAASTPTCYAGRYGIFHDVDEAVAAAQVAFEQLSERSMEERRQIINHIRRIAIDNCVELGTMELNETKVGRLDHKIEKLQALGENALVLNFYKAKFSVATMDWPSSSMLLLESSVRSHP